LARTCPARAGRLTREETQGFLRWVRNRTHFRIRGLLMHRYSIVVASLIAATSARAADTAQALAGQTVVTPPISGYGEVYLGGLRFDGNDYTTRAGGGAARVNVAFAQRWNLQGDAT